MERIFIRSLIKGISRQKARCFESDSLSAANLTKLDMATIVIKSHTEYNSIRSLLRVAIMKSDTYEDRYIRVIVKNAQQIVDDPDFKNSLTSDEYRFSTALTSMRKEELLGFKSEKLGKDDFVKLLQFFDNL